MVKTSKKITTINVQSIPCYCSIGIDEVERKIGQELLFDVHVDINSTMATQSDNIKNTVSYVDIFGVVQKISKDKPHSLIETLAEEIAETLLKHPIILNVKVVVHKPHIPYPGFQGDVSVEINRSKQG